MIINASCGGFERGAYHEGINSANCCIRILTDDCMLCCRQESQDCIETQIIVREVGKSYTGNSYKAIKLRVMWRTLNNFDFVKSKNY